MTQLTVVYVTGYKDWMVVADKESFVCVCVCMPYLDDSIKPWDGVDLSSLSDQLALDLIPHRLDSMSVWTNECHALCRLATKQRCHEI